MVHLHMHLDVRASCNDGLEQIAPLVLSPKSERPSRRKQGCVRGSQNPGDAWATSLCVAPVPVPIEP